MLFYVWFIFFRLFFLSLYSRLFRTFLTDECKRCDCGEFRIIKLYEWMLFVSITFIAQFCIRCLCSHSFDWLKCSLSLGVCACACAYMYTVVCARACVYISISYERTRFRGQRASSNLFSTNWLIAVAVL